MTEDEIVGWQHQFNGHEFEPTLGDSGQRSLVCYSLWGHKESDTPSRLDNEQQEKLAKIYNIFIFTVIGKGPDVIDSNVTKSEHDIWNIRFK